MSEHQSKQRKQAAKVHYGMALGWLKRGRIKVAIEKLKCAIEEDKTYLQPYLTLGKTWLKLRRWNDLIVLCQGGLNYLPEVAELHKWLITAISEKGTLDDAYDEYQLKRLDQRCLRINQDEILCCVVVRNECVRIPYFVQYYRRLGVSRFFFVDNGSDDGTVEWLLNQEDVHVWHSCLPFNQANFGSAWFELILRRYGTGHWCLTVDVDEFLIYADAPDCSLPQFCSELDQQGKQVATGILLDLYSNKPIVETQYHEGEDPLQHCCYFDRKPYHRRYENGGQYNNQTIFLGGARQRVFCTEMDYILSKAVLLRYGTDVVLTPGQHLTNTHVDSIAKEVICLLHFKFLSTFKEYAEREAIREVHAQAAKQYKAYQRELERNPTLTLFDPQKSIAFKGAEQLVELGILQPKEKQPTSDIVPVLTLEISEAERPLLSVMITVYERTEHIQRALASVLAQADNTMQIEVVCDHSQPHVQARLREIVKQHAGDRVQFHAVPKRLGHPEIFNLCIHRAQGHWIHFLHDDDWLEPGFYSLLRSAMEKPEAQVQGTLGALCCQHKIVTTAPGVDQTVTWDSWLERETPGIIEDWLERIVVECRVQFSSMVVRRSAFEALGGFCSQARSAFDWEMWVRIAANYPVYYVPEVKVNIGCDVTAESSQLMLSGEQVRDAWAAIEVMQAQLPLQESLRLIPKAHARTAAYALELANKYWRQGNHEAALNNLRASLQGQPSPQMLSLIKDMFY